MSSGSADPADTEPVGVSLRAVRVADAAAMAGVLADPALYAFTAGTPPSREELAARYERQERGRSPDGAQEWVNAIVVLGRRGRPIGYVQATHPLTTDDPTEIAWVLGTPWQGQGHAWRAVRLLLDELAARGVREVVAHIHPDHRASARVAARVGMTPTEVVVDGETRWTGSTGLSAGRGR